MNNDNNEDLIYENKIVLDLAKRRLAMKKNLKYQILDFCVIMFTFILLINITYPFDRFIIAFMFCLFWGIRLMARILKFLKPTLKNGIFEYFKEREKQLLEEEYNRLNKKDLNYIEADYK